MMEKFANFVIYITICSLLLTTEHKCDPLIYSINQESEVNSYAYIIQKTNENDDILNENIQHSLYGNDCPAGYYGVNCTKPCDCDIKGSIGISCNYFGECQCDQHYFGVNCGKRCNANCTNGCNKYGHCICPRGKYGMHCDKNCSIVEDQAMACHPNGLLRCIRATDDLTTPCKSNQFCDYATGQCRCKGLKSNATCDVECDCDPDNTIYCTKQGTCVCKNGFDGPRCQNVCRSDCVNAYAINSCIDGRCNCLDGFYGERCERACQCHEHQNNNMCNRFGHCIPTIQHLRDMIELSKTNETIANSSIFIPSTAMTTSLPMTTNLYFTSTSFNQTY